MSEFCTIEHLLRAGSESIFEMIDVALRTSIYTFLINYTNLS